ncbi:MAG: hypothetical protein M3Y57_20480 [Acidobacteriota bacterium]|nr:hypothetical protein [Acidobacteriota bacterium]
MDVRPAGTDPAAAANVNSAAARVSSITKPAAVQPAALPLAAGDSISLLLKELSPPDILKLLQILEPPVRLESSALLATILQAVSEHDIAAVLSTVQEMASQNPQLADSLRSYPGLNAVRPEIYQLLDRLSSVAKFSAEEKLGQAAELVDRHSAMKLLDWDTPPGALLGMGRTLLDAGGLGNYVKADDVAQVMIDALRFLPIPDEVRIAAIIESRRNGQVHASRRSLPWDRAAFRLRSRWTLILLLLLVLASLLVLLTK